MKLDKIDVVSDFKIINVREIKDSGKFNRRALSPDMTLADDEHQEIKDMAEELWTDEVKTAFETHKAEKEAKLNSE